MYIPSELIIYILSFLEKKYINFKSKKCIYRTLQNRCCKIKTNAIFCHIHRDYDLANKLSFTQCKTLNKCKICNKNCINENYNVVVNFYKWYFCSEKCKDRFFFLSL